ncbi:hypothetical protein EXE59_19005 [Nocardioides eburneiflavus]|uniref:Uncharacterized protein n=1 Tax=Nocardioides eburneiflavus TaxID=2518372 RepID=A0A4Z1CLE5_9ACTN|nr:hypothetical protein [Nocardioides eburneiflavus]TGN65810.1 hypothetical protein EXE59_19005 [Nocardioides eburneiflavus]
MTAQVQSAYAALRPADVVLSPDDLGGARATRHSFSRSLVRRAVAGGWDITLGRADLDEHGCGVVVFDVSAEGHRWSFVAFSQTIDESDREDRVVASSWDVTAALVDGAVDDDDVARLRPEVIRQEQGRADERTLIWTRANRSGRFFEYVVDRLADGAQPEPGVFGLSPYLLRSTAFYSNGKFGLADFERFEHGHPFAVPYRAHMLSAWLLRELGYELAERCAAARSETAVRLDGDWRRYFGLGNATGLGMVPYVVNHPEVLDAWIRLRELPLADVVARTVDRTGPDVPRVRTLLERAARYLAEQGDTEPTPYTSGAKLAAGLRPIQDLLTEYATYGTMGGAIEAQPWQHLHEAAAAAGSEVRGVVASVLTELADDLDDVVEASLTCQERRDIDPKMRCGELRGLIDADYDWLREFDFTDPTQTERFWYSSANNEEPRRAYAGVDPGERVQHAVDVARAVHALSLDLAGAEAATSVGEFLLGHPWHRGAVARVQSVRDLEYAELHANLLAGDFLPLHVQRLQLAVYGMDNYNPQSTDWLRVTLFSGAPRVADLVDGTADDDWSFTPQPSEADERTYA